MIEDLQKNFWEPMNKEVGAMNQRVGTLSIGLGRESDRVLSKKSLKDSESTRVLTIRNLDLNHITTPRDSDRLESIKCWTLSNYGFIV